MSDFSYSAEALMARFSLFEGINTINIFVEDFDQEYEYETIFKKLLGDSYKINSIFAMGGKDKVIEAFQEFGEKKDEVNNVYLVDGDFDRILYKETMIDNEHFIYLEAYNIENYLINKEAAELYLKGKLQKEDHIIESRLSYNQWLEKIIIDSSHIFLCHCFVKKYYPDKKTLSRPVFKHFLNDKTGFLQDGAIERYYDEIESFDKDSLEKIEKIKEVYLERNEDYFNLICGKYLLNSLVCYIKNIIKTPINNQDFRWFLVNNLNINNLDFVKEKIESL